MPTKGPSLDTFGTKMCQKVARPNYFSQSMEEEVGYFEKLPRGSEQN